MNTDSFFEIGSTHEICQDYAISGKINENISYAIVSDGCSQSQKNCSQVDLGARVLSYAAKEAITDIYGQLSQITTTEEDKEDFSAINTIIRNKISDTMVVIGKFLKLSKLYGDCTLLIAVSDGYTTNVFIYGDGGAAVTFDDGSIIFKNVIFESGAPYYLSYGLDQERNAAYKIQFGAPEAHVDTHLFDFEGEYIKNEGQVCEANETIYDNASFSVKGAQTISVFSDGIGSFEQSSEDKGIVNQSHLDIIKEYVGFKNRKGEFVQRRMKRMLQNQKALNITHYDDISIATINLA